MKDFKRGGFNDRGGDRPRFGNKSGFKKNNTRHNDAPRQMHPVICSGCGVRCEVPFRPSGDKQVFCNNCFSSQKEQGFGNFAPKKRFERGSNQRFDHNNRRGQDFKSSRRSVPVMDERNNRRIDELKAQVAGLSAQMKEVMALINTKAESTPVDSSEKLISKKVANKKAAVKKATVKKVAKTEAKKKTAAKKK